MNEIKLEIGVDVSAYATLDVPHGYASDPDSLRPLVDKLIEDGQFEVDWDSSGGTRIVRVLGATSQPQDGDARRLDGYRYEASFQDAGYSLREFLCREIDLQALVANAAGYGLIPSVGWKGADGDVASERTPVMETRTGMLTIGEATLSAPIKVRKGASDAELRLALIDAVGATFSFTTEQE
jgi:hypothetical protein